MYKRILVPLDGSHLAEQILPHVESLARSFGAAVVLLRAVSSAQRLITETAAPMGVGVVGGPVIDPATAADLVEDERREAEAYLASRALDLMGRVGAAPAGEGGKSVPSVRHECPEGDAAALILERARATDADLIAMTTHGRGGLGRLVFGSVADAVLRSAPCPILLVRIREEHRD
jgi:nucleotide-binding universal stress UspA family protein